MRSTGGPAWSGSSRARPIRIVGDGRVHLPAMRRELLTLSEPRSALRKQGIMRASDCKLVVLEPDGTLSAVRSDLEQHSLQELAYPPGAAKEGGAPPGTPG